MSRPYHRAFLYFCFVAGASLAGCGGGGGGGGGPISTPPNSPPVAAGPIEFSENPLRVLGTGSSYVHAVFIGEKNYNGSFNADYSKCAGIASGPSSAVVSGVDPTGNLPWSVASFPLTGAAVGKCSLTITDTLNQSATLNVSVTTTGVVTQ